jgi:spore coat protein H
MNARRVALGCALGLLSAIGPGVVSAQNEDTHGREATPDYARVFAQDVVNRMDIRIAASDWQAVLADMQSMAGASGFGLNVGFSPQQLAACSGRIVGEACTASDPPVAGRCAFAGFFNPGQLACAPIAGAGNGRDDVELLPRTPVYVPADVSYDGETFRRVGFRLKGNSTLLFTWRRGSDKLPFRLNFDGLESRFPETRDQTFFGFPNLSFVNQDLDPSYLRAKVVTDLFRDAGVPSAAASFMRVFLDRGTGLSYLGLYTMIEVPDGPMLNRAFRSDEGNLYKPNGTGGRWTMFTENGFPKRTNQEAGDWTDIQGAITVLHEPKADRARWRTRFEARFDVPVFLRWLALNTIIGNIDVYGGVSGHNYYVYGSPRHRDRIFWIPWDHDLAMPTGGLGTPLPTAPIDLFHNNVSGTNWPLIRFLLDDPVYRAAYRANVQDLLSTVFEPSRVSVIMRTEQARIFPFVIGPQGEPPQRNFAGTAAQFDASLFGTNGLINYVANRHARVTATLQATP